MVVLPGGEKVWAAPFRYNTGVGRTDIQTRRTDVLRQRWHDSTEVGPNLLFHNILQALPEQKKTHVNFNYVTLSLVTLDEDKIRTANTTWTDSKHRQLEGHSVERIYLRQMCSHGSRWIKPFQNHASMQRRAPNTYTSDFPDVITFRVAAHTISEKAIRFQHPDCNPDRAQKLTSSSMSRHLSTRNISSKSMHVFLSRVSILTRDIDIGILSVRPSVRNVPVLDENGLTYCHSLFTLR